MEEIKSKEIIGFIHCKQCIKEIDTENLDVSPQEYINLEIGINIDNQLMIGCVRHDTHVGAFTLHEQINIKALEKGCESCE